jgi:ribosomal protein S18 acetylase RimI-like enzyme
MKVEPDDWLAGIFGYDVFRLSLAADESTVSPAAIFASPAPRAFYYAKVPVANVGQAGALTAMGFRVVDTNVLFERAPDPQLPAASALAVREAEPEEREAVLAIAATCFVYSRFHLDPQVPAATANAVKREWVANYFRKQRGERLLVAVSGGQPVGFLALLALSGPARVGVIDLVGVDRAWQKRGVGRRLVEHLVHESPPRYDHLRVGTQIANLPSIRLYEACGFRAAGAEYVLHAHTREGQVLP